MFVYVSPYLYCKRQKKVCQVRPHAVESNGSRQNSAFKLQTAGVVARSVTACECPVLYFFILYGVFLTHFNAFFFAFLRVNGVYDAPLKVRATLHVISTCRKFQKTCFYVFFRVLTCRALASVCIHFWIWEKDVFWRVVMCQSFSKRLFHSFKDGFWGTLVPWFCCTNLNWFRAKLTLYPSGQLFTWFFSRLFRADFKVAPHQRAPRALFELDKSYGYLSNLRSWPKTTFLHFVKWAVGLNFELGPNGRRPRAPLEVFKWWGYLFISRVWLKLTLVKNWVF
jgi:hypothetical protein